jgi:hypothetical protein
VPIKEDRIKKRGRKKPPPGEDDEGAPRLYQLLYEPKHIDELEWRERHTIMIWRENETILCLGIPDFNKYPRRFSFMESVRNYQLYVTIYGDSDAAIAETATFFLTLQHPPEEESGELRLYPSPKSWPEATEDFDMAALPADQLAQILDNHPRHRLYLSGAMWNDAQSRILPGRILWICTSGLDLNFKAEEFIL